MGEDVKKGWHEKFFTEAELKEFAEIGKNDAGAVPKEQNMIAPEVWAFIKKVHAAGPKR